MITLINKVRVLLYIDVTNLIALFNVIFNLFHNFDDNEIHSKPYDITERINEHTINLPIFNSISNINISLFDCF